MKFSDHKLIAMDMDSTLITIECIDEIADFAGCKPAVAAITASAMRGEIDWPTSFTQRVALLSGLDQRVLQRVYDERLQLTPGAEQLIDAAHAAGCYTLLVSGGFTFFTDRIKARLRLPAAHSNTLEITNGKLTGRVLGALCDANAKARHVREAASALGITRDAIMVIGDGANDIPMMREAGTSMAFRAKPLVREAATHAINEGGLDEVLRLLDD
jgi:phosphoserine phosphatase